jgi:hypothetical protein
MATDCGTHQWVTIPGKDILTLTFRCAACGMVSTMDNPELMP